MWTQAKCARYFVINFHHLLNLKKEGNLKVLKIEKEMLKSIVEFVEKIGQLKMLNVKKYI